MLNTGLRTGELLGLLNSDIGLEHKYLEVRQGVKEVCKWDGVEYAPGREVKVGKTKTATSKRRVPQNQAAVQAIAITPGTVFRPHSASCERREGRLHQTSGLPQTVLLDSQGGRDSAEMVALIETHVWKQFSKRNKIAQRYAYGTLA